MSKSGKNDVYVINASDAHLEEIAVKGWIFAHGIASLVATNMMVYDKERIENCYCLLWNN